MVNIRLKSAFIMLIAWAILATGLLYSHFLDATRLLIGSFIILFLVWSALDYLFFSVISHFSQKLAHLRETQQRLDGRYFRRKDELGILARQFNFIISDLAFARSALNGFVYQKKVEAMATAVLQYIQYISESARHPIHPPETPQAKLELIVKELDKVLYALRQKVPLIHPLFGREDIVLKTIIENTFMRLPRDLSKNITLQLDLSVEQVSSIAIESLTLSYVLLEIMENGCEAIKRVHSKGTLSVTANVENINNRPTLLIAITDDGEGIPSDHLEAIFKTSYYTKKHKRLGAGLSWCRLAIQAMNGQLYAISKGQQGCALHILLPMDTPTQNSRR